MKWITNNAIREAVHRAVAQQRNERTTRKGGSKPPPQTPRPDTTPTPQSIHASGRVRLPLTWRAVCIEQHEHGTIIYAERRGLLGIIVEAIERLLDKYEDTIRRRIWPHL